MTLSYTKSSWHWIKNMRDVISPSVAKYIMSAAHTVTQYCRHAVPHTAPNFLSSYSPSQWWNFKMPFTVAQWYIFPVCTYCITLLQQGENIATIKLWEYVQNIRNFIWFCVIRRGEETARFISVHWEKIMSLSPADEICFLLKVVYISTHRWLVWVENNKEA